jgi:hypothetical protein
MTKHDKNTMEIIKLTEAGLDKIKNTIWWFLDEINEIPRMLDLVNSRV